MVRLLRCRVEVSPDPNHPGPSSKFNLSSMYWLRDSQRKMRGVEMSLRGRFQCSRQWTWRTDARREDKISISRRDRHHFHSCVWSLLLASFAHFTPPNSTQVPRYGRILPKPIPVSSQKTLNIVYDSDLLGLTQHLMPPSSHWTAWLMHWTSI